jgi:hypothetical protein
MWLKQNRAEIIAVLALFVSTLVLVLQLRQWQLHGDNLMPLAMTITGTLMGWILLGIAVVLNRKDLGREKRARLKLDNERYEYQTKLHHLQSGNNGLVDGLAKKQEEINELLARHQKTIEELQHNHVLEMENLKTKHAHDANEARVVIVQSAKWGIGGPYSQDVTSHVGLFLKRFANQTEIFRASVDLFGEAGHPGEPKLLEVHYKCPRYGAPGRKTFRENEPVNL